MKKMPDLWIIVVICVLVIAGLAAMFTTGGEDARRARTPVLNRNNFRQPGNVYRQNNVYPQPYYNPQPQMYQYPYAGNQRVALPVYSGPSCAPGSIQVPEIGAEVLVAHSGGLMVTRVYQNSHADRDGLCVGDIITKFDGKKITSPDMFFQAISAASPEMFIKFGVLRSGKSQTLSIMMGKRELDGVVVPPDAAPAHPFAIPG